MDAGNSDEQQPGKKRVPGRPFKKGQSGNPRGIPKGIAQIKDMHTPYGEEALLRLVELMRNGGEKVAFHAAKEILDRILGRTTQQVSGPDGAAIPIDFDVLTMLRRIAEHNG